MKILLMAVTATAETGTGPGTITGKIVGRADDKINQTPTAIYLTGHPALTRTPFANRPRSTLNRLSYSGMGTDIHGDGLIHSPRGRYCDRGRIFHRSQYPGDH
jgi:hypothetical protein